MPPTYLRGDSARKSARRPRSQQRRKLFLMQKISVELQEVVRLMWNLFILSSYDSVYCFVKPTNKYLQHTSTYITDFIFDF